MELKDKIRDARSRKNLTQKELAELAGLTQATITKIETGNTTNPSIDVAFKIAHVLGEDVYTLFGDEPIKNTSITLSESEKDQLKSLALSALERYVTTKIFSSQLEINENLSPDEEWNRHIELSDQLNEFKKGIYEAFVMIGFCSLEEITEFKESLKSAKVHLFKEDKKP